MPCLFTRQSKLIYAILTLKHNSFNCRQRLRLQRPIWAFEEGGEMHSITHFFYLDFKRFLWYRRFFSRGDFSLELEIPTPKQLQTFPGPLRSFSGKKNHIGSVVSEILLYKLIDEQIDRQTDRQTYRHTDILLLYYRNVLYNERFN